MKPIRMLILDVDGTLTDGKIYLSAQGELFKTFDVRDGYGICNILPRFGITAVVISGRTSPIVEHRCAELGIAHCYQGVDDKAACLQMLSERLDIPLSQAACIGDDENDIPMIKLCEVSGCPANAVSCVKEKCDHVCSSSGGDGAVREFIEWLIAT